MTIDTMTSAACLVNRCAACRGQVLSLAYVGPCQCPAECHVQDPADELEVLADQIEDRHEDAWTGWAA